MQLSHFFLFVGTAAALAFPAPNSGDSDMCCCCDVSRNAIVCNPDKPADDCICTLAKCPDDAPTITESPPKPTPEPKPPATPVRRNPPPPPAGMDWCCCCNGKDYVCSAHPKGSGCFCPAIACPEDAQTIYPTDRPGRPDRPDRPGRPDRPTI